MVQADYKNHDPEYHFRGCYIDVDVIMRLKSVCKMNARVVDRWTSTGRLFDVTWVERP